MCLRTYNVRNSGNPAPLPSCFMRVKSTTLHSVYTRKTRKTRVLKSTHNVFDVVWFGSCLIYDYPRLTLYACHV